MRPRRLYVDSKTHKPFYLIKGEKVFIKIPKKMTMNQLQKVNIKNIIKIGTAKRVKRRTGRRFKGKFTKKITQGMATNGEIQIATSEFALPTYLFQEQKKIAELATAGKRPLQLSFIPGLTTLPKAEVIPTLIEPEKPVLPPIGAYDLTEKKVLPPIKSELPIKPVMSTREKNFQERQLGIKIPEHRVTTVLRKSKEMIEAEKESMDRNSPPLSPETIERMAKEQEQERKGKGGNNSDDEGLYNNEIEKIAKKRMKHFVPCIASDETLDLLQYVKRGDTEFSFVINTNPSDSNGSGKDGYRTGHWTCVYIDNRDDYPSCEFFDPLVQGKIPIAVVNIIGMTPA